MTNCEVCKEIRPAVSLTDKEFEIVAAIADGFNVQVDKVLMKSSHMLAGRSQIEICDAFRTLFLAHFDDHVNTKARNTPAVEKEL